MAWETNSATLFEAEQRAALEHLAGDIFEADRRLDQLQLVRRAHLVHHGGRRDRFDDPSPALSIHDEMVQ